jgi:hypothetical protein
MKKRAIVTEDEKVIRFAIAHLFTRRRFDRLSRRAIRLLITKTAHMPAPRIRLSRIDPVR